MSSILIIAKNRTARGQSRFCSLPRAAIPDFAISILRGQSRFCNLDFAKSGLQNRVQNRDCKIGCKTSLYWASMSWCATVPNPGGASLEPMRTRQVIVIVLWCASGAHTLCVCYNLPAKKTRCSVLGLKSEPSWASYTPPRSAASAMAAKMAVGRGGGSSGSDGCGGGRPSAVTTAAAAGDSAAAAASPSLVLR